MSSNYSLRPATVADESFLWEMLYVSIHVPVGRPRPPREILQEPVFAHYVADWGIHAGDQGVIAVDERTGAPVGAAWFRLFSADDPSWGFIDPTIPDLGLAIVAEHRGQGLGRALMERLIELAQGQYPALSLSVDPDNTIALGLYQRLGFVVVGSSGTSWTMKKEI